MTGDKNQVKNSQNISKKFFFIHPFLFAIFPIIFLFSQNVNSASPNDIIFPLIIVILVTFLIWIALSLLLKNRIKSGFITSLGLIIFFSYGHIYILLDNLQRDVDFSHILLLIPTLILFGLGVYYFIKTKRPLNNATKIVNVISIALIMISFVTIGEYFITEDYYLDSLSEDPEESIFDNKVINISVDDGEFEHWELTKFYTEPLNLKNFEYVKFSWLGQGDDNWYVLNFISADGQKIWYRFQDSWIGWKQVIIPTKMMDGTEDVFGVKLHKMAQPGSSWDKISKIEFKTESSTKNNKGDFYFSGFVFDNKITSSTVKAPNIRISKVGILENTTSTDWAVRGLGNGTISIPTLNDVFEKSSSRPTITGSFPDVYYIILDSYAGSKSLQINENYDNSEFLDYLTKKGFFVASESFSNYQRTIFSITSTLNMKYLNYLAEEKGTDSTDRNELKQMTHANPVFQNFKSKGYTIYSIESGAPLTANIKLVDFRLCSTNNFATSDFVMMLIRTTIINPIHVELFSGDERDKILCGFSELAKMSNRDDKPKFVFAHIMIPHKPYIFGEHGEPLNPKILTLNDQEEALDSELYLGQLKFATKKIREVIEKLTDTDTPPIIIIQSDHGMRSGDYQNEYERYLKLFNNFKAYYFPDKGRNMEFETTTPVNTFRIFFNLYFDDNYELLEDRLYMNRNETPWQITDITEILMNPN